MDIKTSANSAQIFKCEHCHIECSKKNDWERHVLTRKHKKNSNGNIEMKIPLQNFTCKCGKNYVNNSGLWKHSKKCNINNINIEIKEITEQKKLIDKDLDLKQLLLETKKQEEKNIIVENNVSENTLIEKTDKVIEILIKENTDFKNIILEFMKNSSDMQKQLIDVCKNSNNTIISQNNSHNKTFNLQFFLNEQCKDAMNLSEFANSFDLQLSDLEIVGELGYVEGITKIMVDKLNSMDVYKRPIHCSDAKREIIYVKEENVWTKEEKDNPKLRQAIKNISFRNMKLVYNWSNAYPESKDNQSKLNDKYMHLVIESTGGKGPIMESENKIIRRIAKEILIDKM